MSALRDVLAEHSALDKTANLTPLPRSTASLEEAPVEESSRSEDQPFIPPSDRRTGTHIGKGESGHSRASAGGWQAAYASSSETQSSEWSAVTDPVERRKIQNKLAQQRFRAKAREQIEDASVRESSYAHPTAAQLEDHHTLSGLPWGGISFRHIVAAGRDNKRSSQQISREKSVDALRPGEVEHIVAAKLDKKGSPQQSLRGGFLYVTHAGKSYRPGLRLTDRFTRGDAALGPLAVFQHQLDPKVMKYQDPLEPIHIDCVCGRSSDHDQAQEHLPEEWRWDVQYQPKRGVWTCTPLDIYEPSNLPLTIAGAPVVLPVEHQWPPIGGVNPPPDPRFSSPIDCRTTPSEDVIRDVFVTFEGSIGFYILIDGLLQIIIPPDFDTTRASSHLPHKFGGLKVSYIEQTFEPTMLPSKTATTKTKSSLGSTSTSMSNLFRLSQPSTIATTSLRLNDFIEARGKSTHREKYTGRIGLNVSKGGVQYLLMSSHVIAEAILAKSFFGRGRTHFERLQGDWNQHADIWAGNEKIGSIEKIFDPEAEIYPNGFKHDIALIKPNTTTSIQGVKSPIDGLGWLSHDAWSALRQQTSAVKILGSIETQRDAKTLRCSLCSDVLVVGEGIFLNQTSAAGAKSLKDHDKSTWTKLVSRAMLYRVSPDFDPPNGYSGIALYAESTREDGSEGPGIVGFQSFVQRSGQVQNYNMEGPALEQRLQKGRVAFYGAFEVPDELRQGYTIV